MGSRNFYRKRTLEKHTSFEQKALFQGMEDGVIKETQAPELAGYANGDTLGKGFGGNPLQRAFVKFNEWGAFMFEMSEQFNRRLVFRAALDLAQKIPLRALCSRSGGAAAIGVPEGPGDAVDGSAGGGVRHGARRGE